MKLLAIDDVDFDQLGELPYDLCVFASGNEERATWVIERLSPDLIQDSFVMGFEEGNSDLRRVENDRIFQERLRLAPSRCNSDDDRVLLEALLQTIGDGNRPRIRILVDYSCMSRTWYGGVIGLMRTLNVTANIEIDFVYAVGVYDLSYEEGVIKGIGAVPGFEGTSWEGTGSLAVMGMGFHANASLCVLDQLESDLILPIVADPAVVPDYVGVVLDKNFNLISDPRSLPLMRLPCMNVRLTWEYLVETLSPFLGKRQITLVPMGPKTHSLAFLLMAFHYPEICCLRVSFKHSDSRNVAGFGRAAVSRVLFVSGDLDDDACSTSASLLT